MEHKKTDAKGGVKRPTKTVKDDMVAWFRGAKFGLFIHWGLYSLLGKGEWVQNAEKIPVEKYEQLQKKFNPRKFNPDTWAELAQAAGMKYTIVTAKHHDGFCMFDSTETDYDIMRTPYRKDIMVPLVKAFRKQGLRVGFYYSIMDWHHPDYLPRRPWETEEARPARGARFERYVRYIHDQVCELLSNYGEVFCLWWDGGWEVTPQAHHADRLHEVARKIQPWMLINDRAGIKEDLVTPEQRIPPTGITDENGKPLMWEACLTMTSRWWGYDRYEKQYKEPEYLIHTLIDIVSKGGNLLLNVGPKPDGTIQQEVVDRLKAIGVWLGKYGEAIYETTASPFTLLPFYGRVTVKENRIYCHLFGWPARRELRLPRLRTKVTAAWVLDKKRTPLKFKRDGADWVIKLPPRAPDKVASVVGVDLEGPPKADIMMITPDAKGIVDLPAVYSTIEGTHGQRIRYESSRDGTVHVGNWCRTHDVVSWRFTVPKEAACRLTLNYSLATAQAGSNCVALVNGKEHPFVTVGTGKGFAPKVVADIDLVRGENVLLIKATAIAQQKIMDLRGAVLKKVQ